MVAPKYAKNTLINIFVFCVNFVLIRIVQIVISAEHSAANSAIFMVQNLSSAKNPVFTVDKFLTIKPVFALFFSGTTCTV